MTSEATKPEQGTEDDVVPISDTGSGASITAQRLMRIGNWTASLANQIADVVRYQTASAANGSNLAKAEAAPNRA